MLVLGMFVSTYTFLVVVFTSLCGVSGTNVQFGNLEYFLFIVLSYSLSLPLISGLAIHLAGFPKKYFQNPTASSHLCGHQPKPRPIIPSENCKSLRTGLAASGPAPVTCSPTRRLLLNEVRRVPPLLGSCRAPLVILERRPSPHSGP